MDEKEFISFWTQQLSLDKIKKFPDDFFENEEITTFPLRTKSLLMGQEFFGEYELTDVSGAEVLKTDSYEKAKYFIYASRSKPDFVNVPKEEKKLKEMVLNYEIYLDSIIRKIEFDFQNKFHASKSFTEVLNKILTRLNLIRL